MRVLELHSPVKLVQRSKGRSAVAAAAYRSGELIKDERTGEIHDYTRKQGIELTALLFPADAPETIHDRASLWNAAESREKHPRAQTAREVEVSFPAEFSFEQRREAGLSIGKLLAERYGVAADMCWHSPNRKGDERNFHCHILFSTRRFENGDWAKNKDRTLDDLYGKGAEEITNLRQGIADVMNNIAARDGLEIYVEHLSFEKRGLDREPSQHLGTRATAMERRGVNTGIGDKNRKVEELNAERQKLYEQQNIVNLEIARERLRQQKPQRVKTPSQSPAISPQMQPSDPYKIFYQQTQKRRQELLEEQKRLYGEQENQTRQELVQLQKAVDRKGIVGVWRNITGQTQRDREAMSRLRNQLEAIQKRKQEDFRAFERKRQERLEELKKAEQIKQQEQTPANDFEQRLEPTSLEANKRKAYLERQKQQRETVRWRGLER